MPDRAARALAVQIGTDPAGDPVVLDLRTAALIIGPDPDRSEAVRALLFGLAAAHPPEDVNLWLVTRHDEPERPGLARLPHTAAIAWAVGHPTRAGVAAAVHAEVHRRRSLGRDAERAPRLVIVFEGFGDLLAEDPAFLGVLILLVQVGPALGIRLVLTDTRYEAGRPRGLDARLAHRIALRTRTADESTAVIGVPDAADLPGGRGLLRVDDRPPRPFRPVPTLLESLADRLAGTGTAAPVLWPPASSSIATPYPPPPLDDPLAAARFAAFGADLTCRLLGVRELLDLAVRPGADARQIVQTLVAVTDPGSGYPAAAASAEEAIGVIVATVPPPPEDDPTPSDVARLWGIDPAAYDPIAAWRRRTALALPIGVRPDGSPLVLDLRPAAEGGAGPHALVVGATGSGKSELLRTILLGLAATHSPDDVNFLLVDYYGGSTFAGLADLPHVAGVVTDFLDPGWTGARRLAAAVAGELTRRQERLRAGHAMPSLVVVIEEFDSILSADPGFVDILVQVGRLGRSLGVHLLLATQRFQEGRLRGLDTYLACRIALRTWSAAESRAVIGVPDAYELPKEPGHGLVRAGDSAPERFRVAYASGMHHAAPPGWPRVLDKARHRWGHPTVLSALAGRIAAHGRRARPLWPPALAAGEVADAGPAGGEVADAGPAGGEVADAGPVGG